MWAFLIFFIFAPFSDLFHLRMLHALSIWKIIFGFEFTSFAGVGNEEKAAEEGDEATKLEYFERFL